MNTNKKKGFTLIELLVVIAIIALLIGILLPALGRARQNANQLKDATNLRGIMQSMETWASDNNGSYPNPDRMDIQNATEDADAAAGQFKFRTGAVLGLMIHSSSIVPEQCVSAAEVGPIEVAFGYQFDRPQGARVPTQALWDPTFAGSIKDLQASDWLGSLNNGVQFDASIANNSFAHSVYFGARRTNWKSNLSSSTAIWANRGPEYEATAPSDPSQPKWKLKGAPDPEGGGGAGGGNTETGADSACLFIHGPETSWAGNIAYGDGHASFEKTPAPDAGTYNARDLAGATGSNNIFNDNIFLDEVDELDSGTNPALLRRNAMLRIQATGYDPNSAVPSDLNDVGNLEWIWVDGDPSIN